MKENVTENKLVWHIAGVGALGSLIAGSFQQQGLGVRLILKNEAQFASYQNSGLTILKDERVVTAHPQAVTLDDLGSQPIHYLLCCVKVYDITNLLIRLKNNLNAKSIILLIHNGLGVLNEIKKHLPQLRVISGVSTVGAYLEKAFTVRAFLNGKFYLGQGIGKFTPNETKTICAAFAAAALPYQWLDNIQPILWEKFAINCSINLLTALLGCKNGALLSHQKILKQLTSEAAQVLCAYGVNMSADDLFCKVIDVIEGTADNYSSMYKDVENNKQTEIYYLNERLMTLAHQKELVTPTHSELLNKFYRTFPKQTFGG